MDAVIVCNFKENQQIELEKMTTKNLVSSQILEPLAKFWLQKLFSWNFVLKNVRYCCKLSLYAISRKTNEPNGKKLSFGSDFRTFGPNFDLKGFSKNLALSACRYHNQLSSRTISEKSNDQILRKRRDGQTDESDFIGRCPTNVERPKWVKEKTKMIPF